MQIINKNEPIFSVCFLGNSTGDDMSKSREIFGKNLKRLMKLRRITVNEMAEMVGVQISMISRWRSGANLPNQYIDKLAEVLRVELYEFFIDDVSRISNPTTMEEWVEALANSIGYELRPRK